MNGTLTPLERHLGDLDHPIYHDERTRFVSYEVYSVAYQCLQIGVGIAAAGMAWFGDHATALWGLGIFAILYSTMLYTGFRIKRATAVDIRPDQFTARSALTLAIYFAIVLGLSHQLASRDVSRELALGCVVGGCTAFATAWWKAKQVRKHPIDPADVPDED